MAGCGGCSTATAGATAVEVACKMAYQYWHSRGQARRRRFIAFREGYHGDTLGSVSLGGIDMFHALYPAAAVRDDLRRFAQPVLPSRRRRTPATAVLAQIDQRCAAQAGEVARSSWSRWSRRPAGCSRTRRGSCAGLRELTERHDVLLIADEVATGFWPHGQAVRLRARGRCAGPAVPGQGPHRRLPAGGRHAGDARRSSTPSSASRPTGRTFYHGHTFTGNALGCAAAVASMDLISSPRACWSSCRRRSSGLRRRWRNWRATRTWATSASAA